jgi:methyl-accepting chemotaxis protein
VAGDSFYQLGFALTMISMVASLVTLSFSRDVNISSIVGAFGAALSTSIVGMISRTVVTSFSIQTKERAEKLEQEVEKTILTFTAQLDSLTTHTVASLAKMHSETEQALNDTVELYQKTQIRVNDEYADSMDENLQTIEAAITSLSNKINNIIVSPDMVSRPLEESLSSILNSIKESQKSYAHLVTDMTETNKSLASQIAESNTHIQRHVENMDNAFNQQIKKSSSEYQESIGSISESISGLRHMQINIQANMTDKVSDLANQVDLIMNHLASVSLPLQESTDRINRTLIESTSSLEEMVNFKDELKSLSEVLPTLRANVANMSEETGKSAEKIRGVTEAVEGTTNQLASDISSVYSSLSEQIKSIKVA